MSEMVYLSWPAPVDPTLSQRFGFIIEHLCKVIAARAARNPAVVPVVLLLWSYLRRKAARFERLYRLWQEGRLPPPRRRHPRPLPDPGGIEGSEPEPQAAARRGRLPTRFAWVVKMTPYSAICGAQLQSLMYDPEMARFLEECPQAARLLRPLCLMLSQRPEQWAYAVRRPRPHPAPTAIPDPPQADPPPPEWPAKIIPA